MDIKEIYILTLPDEYSVKKRNACIEAINKSDLNSEINLYFGLDASKEEIPNYFNSGRWKGDLIHLSGTKAVCYSHIGVILSAFGKCQHEDDVVLVLEGDTIVHPQIKEYLDNIDIPEDWDFVHLSYWDPRLSTENQDKINDNLSRLVNDGCTGLFSFLVKPRKVFRRLIDSLPFESEVDNHLTSKLMRRVFSIYVVEHIPWLTSHISEKSVRGGLDDLYWGLSNSQKRQVISFCVFGNEPIYLKGIIENCKLAKYIYPEWEVWVYTNLEELSKELRDLGAIVFSIPEGIHPSYSRFIPINKNRDGITIFRDADSRVSMRERKSVYSWLDSNATLHSMNDHPHHRNNISAGMFGLKPHNLPEIDLYVPYNGYGDDELLLNRVIFPQLKNDCLIHGEFHELGIPHPLKKVGSDFIGKKIQP